LNPLNSPSRLPLLCGKAGAGECTLAQALAPEHRALLFPEDSWLMRACPLGVDLLRLGRSIVLDFPAHAKAHSFLAGAA